VADVDISDTVGAAGKTLSSKFEPVIEIK